MKRNRKPMKKHGHYYRVGRWGTYKGRPAFVQRCNFTQGIRRCTARWIRQDGREFEVE